MISNKGFSAKSTWSQCVHVLLNYFAVSVLDFTIIFVKIINVPEDPRSCLSKMFPPCRSLWQNTTGEFKYSTHFLKWWHFQIFTALFIFSHFRKFTYLTQAISSTKLISRSRDAQFRSCTSPISSNKIPAIDSCHLRIRLQLVCLEKENN